MLFLHKGEARDEHSFANNPISVWSFPCLSLLCLSFTHGTCTQWTSLHLYSKTQRINLLHNMQVFLKNMILGQYDYSTIRFNILFEFKSIRVGYAAPTLTAIMFVCVSVFLQDSNKYSAEIVTSPSLDVFLPEDEDNPYESVTTAVTRKPCSLDISHRLNACTGNGRKWSKVIFKKTHK